MRRLVAAVATVALFAAAAAAAEPPRPLDAGLTAARGRFEAAKTAAAGRADVKTWDGVLADRSKHAVTLFACGSGIQSTDPVEFFVTPAASGKEYEALTVTPARPSDVKAALEFIGLTPGSPVDPAKDRYWARGPRVTISIDLAGKSVRGEDCVVDTNTRKPLPRAGLIFTGSYVYTDDAGKRHVAADESDARPIAPDYNDPAALLDVPRPAPQSVVYGSQKPSPAFTAKAGEPADITIAAAMGTDAVWEAFAEVKAAVIDGKPRYAVRAYATDAPRAAFGPVAADDLPHFVDAIAKLADGRRDLFTTVTIDPAVPVSDVRKLYAVLQAVEKDRGVKLDAPPASELFFRAFFPEPEWRDRTTRLGEPWELFLRRDAGRVSARLERQADDPKAPAGSPPVLTSTTPADPPAFVAAINAGASQWSRAVFVYPPADLTYGELMAWVRPALATYPRVFVFPAEAAATRP